jgi:YVTN family beta-propeller protein/autotransporter-associated beta strand protein
MTNYPAGWRGWRTCVCGLMLAAGLAEPARVDAQMNSYAFVPLGPGGGQSVVAIDTRTRAIVGSPIPVGATVYSVVPSPDGRRLYAAQFTSGVDGNLIVIDAVTRAVIGSPIPIGRSAYSLGITPDGRKVYVANNTSNSVSVIDTATNTVAATIAIPGSEGPSSANVSPDGTRVYVPRFSVNGGIYVIDTATDTLSALPIATPGCGHPLLTLFTPDSQRAYVSCRTTSNVAVIDVAAGTHLTNIAGFSGPDGGAMAPDGSKVFFGSQANVLVRIVDTATNTLLPSVTTGLLPAGVGVTPDGTAVYVSESNANRVEVIDVATMTIAATIPLPAGGYGISQFMGPNILTTACTGCGPLDVASDAALTPLGFGRFVNFNTGILSLSGNWTTNRTLSILTGGGTIQTNGFDATISAPVINDGVLTKEGAGTLTLDGASTHLGGTTMMGGTLIVNASHAAAVRLQGGMLGGIGDIGSIDATAGTIDPGVAGPGILRASAATLVPGVTLAIQINGPDAGTGYDQLVANAGGGVALGGATLIVQRGYVPAAGTAFTIVKNATGTFAGLAEGARLIVNGVPMRITYQGGAGSDVVLTADQPPTITGLTDQSIFAGHTLGPIDFTIGDDETPAAALTVSATSSNQSLLPSAVIVFGGSDTARTLTATPVPGASGETTITVTVSDGIRTAQQSFILTVHPLPVYYLSEGATGGFFGTDLLIANPNAAPAPVEIRFFKDDGTTVLHDVTLAATSRVTIRINEIAGLETGAFSTAVASNSGVPLLVERTMWWDAAGYGAHTEKANAIASSQWYFAEGSQGFFHTYFLLLNPHPVNTVAHVTYFLEGEPAVLRDYPVGATSRLTIDAGSDAALVNRSFGALVTFDLPGMAERAMYFGDAPFFSGGHAAAGVTAPATSWFLAEGATGSFFDTFVLIANPGSDEATLTVTYLPEGGVSVAKPHTLAGNQRLTLNIAAEDPSLANAAVSTRVESNRPVVVERAQYWPHGAWHEAHNSAGETAAGTRWGLAEGRVGGENNAQTYILIANPGAAPAGITATFLRADGTTVVKPFTVQPTSRFTIAVNGAASDVPELANESFGTAITSTQPVIVERALYTDTGGVMWAAGTNATATRLP